MSLRTACDAALRLPGEISWPELGRVQREIEHRFADVPERVPPKFTLDGFASDVDRLWKAEGSLSHLSTKARRWLAHVLFHPFDQPLQWPARDRGLVRAALREIGQRPRFTRSLLKRLLVLWPQELPTNADLRNGLADLLRRDTGVRLREWQRRVQEYQLLSADAPKLMAARMARHRDAARTVLADAGLTGELATSGFVASVEAALCAEIESSLRAGRHEHGLALLPLLVADGRLRFPHLGARVAEALLRPSVGRPDPPTNIQDAIQAFLLTHLKDPRLTRTAWISVDRRSEEVMLRWLVRSSLQDFFGLIERWALDHHWRYRHAFWSAYYSQRYLTEAWVVLGESARGEAMRRWGSAAPAHGQLTGAGDPSQSVLLMRIGDVIIAEWSHNGSCRLWSAANDAAPKMYRATYSRGELRQDSNHEQRHDGNLYYTWQQRLADVIRRQTGIAMNQVAYRVR